MKIIKSCLWALPLMGMVVGCFDNDDKDRQTGVSVVENEIVGRILLENGDPAAGAKVSLFRAEEAGKPVIEGSASASGEYRFSGIKAGSYSILARQSALVTFQDAIALVSGKLVLPDRLLRVGGKVRTAVVLKPGDDISSVTAVILGSDFISKPKVGGDLGMDGMPEGKLRIRITSTIPGYLPLEAQLDIISGEETLVDTLHLPFVK